MERKRGPGGGTHRFLSPLNVWALSFGCAVGWGAFVMPGTTFLPAAGPLGTALGIVIGAAVMMVIGVNYHYLMNKFPDAGGTLTFSTRTFGYDHGFLSAWFLVLVYVAIIWANATALTLIARNLLGSTFQFGFYYQILGYDVYLGEALLSIAAILLFGLCCIKGKRLAMGIQTVLALLLIGGVAVTAFAVLGKGGGMGRLSPPFAPNGVPPLRQVLTIVALTPWAFVGFESVSQSVEDFRFPVKKSVWIFAASLTTGALAYLLLSLMAAGILPEGYENWAEYTADLGNLSGLAALPVFHATQTVMGRGGLLLLGVTVCAAIITGLVGNTIAASRLLYAMAEDNILPAWFGKLSEDGVPKNAIAVLMSISVWIPFLGRTAVGWIVDVNPIGATIAS
ncbi:MAG: APC family permease, partial [Oscillibacter sp.]|nr:APC family permease [Oscillibacter sp.]